MSQTAFCIFVNTFCEGAVPSVRDGNGRPFLFKTEVEAQREIAENVISRLREFLKGNRDYEDAMTMEEYIVPVRVYTDTLIQDNDGHWIR